MRQSIFRKELTAFGKQGTVRAEVLTTMNYDSKTVTGTHAATHDNYSRNIPIHKVECFVNGEIWKKIEGLDSELEVLNESELWIKETKIHIEELANEEPSKTFDDKMSELFS